MTEVALTINCSYKTRIKKPSYNLENIMSPKLNIDNKLNQLHTKIVQCAMKKMSIST